MSQNDYCRGGWQGVSQEDWEWYWAEKDKQYSSKTPEEKGKEGELAIIHSLLKAYDITLFHNIELPTVIGITTEVDILLVTTKGVFVIESKNLFGSISGELKDSNWKVSYPNGKTISFMNPILQNQYHIKTLKNLFESNIDRKLYSNNDLYKSILIFGNSASVIPTLLGQISGLGFDDTQILKFHEMEKLLDRLRYEKPLMTENMVTDIYDYLMLHYRYKSKTRGNFEVNWEIRNDSIYANSTIYSGESNPL